jgi:hypothetical protein
MLLAPLHKIYDRVELVFLRNMVTKLGFYERWVDLMMERVSVVSHAICYNSHEAG